MQVAALFEAMRRDYLDDIQDNVAGDASDPEYLWGVRSFCRYIAEAERQACNRADLLYDDASPEFTRIRLVAGQASYAFHPKLTVIERFIWNGKDLCKKTKDMLDRENPGWRTLSGFAGKPLMVLVQGRRLRLIPSPAAEDIAVSPYLNLEVYRLPRCQVCDLDYEPEIPEEYHRDLIYWCLHEAYKKQDADTFNQEKSDYYLARFTQAFGPYVDARVRAHQFETPRSLQIIPHRYTPAVRVNAQDDW